MSSSSGSVTQRIRLSDIKAMPWKNGGGVTREIATGLSRRPGTGLEPGSDAGSEAGNALGSDPGWGWGWRVSLADVAQDGPFSIFPGVERVIAVIDGAGMDLIAPDGRTIALEPFQPARLDGDAALTGRLRRGAVRDLNVMVLRAQFTAEMEIHQGPVRLPAEAGPDDCLLIHLLQGGCSVTVNDGDPLDLAPAETLLHEGQGRDLGKVEIELAAASRAAVIRIRPR
ncbi:MAG: HutD family protein [Kiloniellaceae bacterium]